MPINSFLYPGAKVVPPFTVANSLRFDGSSSNLSRTKGTSDSTKIGTYSWWIKNSKFTGQNLIDCGDAFANSASVYISSNNTLSIYARVSNTNVLVLETDREFRDSAAWHNIVVAIDTTQGTASNRAKVYVDGVQQTSFSTETYPDQNADLRFFTSSETEKISSTIYETGGFFGGYMCEVVKVDGQALAPTSFGEFDEDSPTIWKPIDVSGLTFGTNGYYLDFEDSSNLGNNVSGGTDFTENNIAATDQSTDTCTNNGCTIINASSASATYTLSEGNLKVEKSASNWYGVPRGSIGVSSGKWYYEIKVTDENNNFMAGYMSATNLADVGDRQANGFEKLNGFQSSGYVKRQDNTEVNISSSFQWNDGDIAQIALDMDNKKLWIGKNDSYYNSGDPASGSNETIGSSYFTAGEAYLPAFTCNGTNDASFNFGSPPYSISSGNSDGNGHGNFEYSVPSGYYALNTKNLAEFG